MTRIQQRLVGPTAVAAQHIATPQFGEENADRHQVFAAPLPIALAVVVAGNPTFLQNAAKRGSF